MEDKIFKKIKEIFPDQNIKILQTSEKGGTKIINFNVGEKQFKCSSHDDNNFIILGTDFSFSLDNKEKMIKADKIKTVSQKENFDDTKEKIKTTDSLDIVPVIPMSKPHLEQTIPVEVISTTEEEKIESNELKGEKIESNDEMSLKIEHNGEIVYVPLKKKKSDYNIGMLKMLKTNISKKYPGCKFLD
jgi:hypothetical protein